MPPASGIRGAMPSSAPAVYGPGRSNVSRKVRELQATPNQAEGKEILLLKVQRHATWPLEWCHLGDFRCCTSRNKIWRALVDAWACAFAKQAVMVSCQCCCRPVLQCATWRIDPCAFFGGNRRTLGACCSHSSISRGVSMLITSMSVFCAGLCRFKSPLVASACVVTQTRTLIHSSMAAS